VLLDRVTPLVRSSVSIAAGAFEMPLALYIVLTLAGSAVGAFALAGAGWAAGTGYGTIHHDWRYVEVAVVLCALLGLAYVVRRRFAPRT
jgi:membrane protein DedA with SNARE-associated domain